MIVEFLKKHDNGRNVFPKGKKIRLTNEYAKELIDKKICKGLDEEGQELFVKSENELLDKNLE